MEPWIERALKRWPNVPALYGWLSLDRRGRWRIRGETISRPQIIDTINANYAADERGCWYFQNGPQRGYMALEYAPLVLRRADPRIDRLVTHTNHDVVQATAAYLDETGTVLLATEHGPGVVLDSDLDWLLTRMSSAGKPVDEHTIAAALALPSGAATPLELDVADLRGPLVRLDAVAAPEALGFVRDPQPDLSR
jgi:hypothetical protein